MNELLAVFSEKARLAWRFRWQAVLVAWLVAGIGWLVVYGMPNKYEVDTRVHVNTRSLLQPLIANMAANPNLQSQVALLTKTLLNRNNLQQIARQTDMSLQATTRQQKIDMLDKLHHDIKIEGGGRENLFKISYTNTSPDTAYAVIQQMINILTEKALGMSQESSHHAKAFLLAQVNAYGDKLDKAEQRLAQFKKNHMSAMGGGYFSKLQSARNSRIKLKDQLDTARHKRAELQRQITQMQNGKAQTSPSLSPHVQLLSQELAQDRQRLNQMLLKYTAQHPDVIALKHRIARLKEKRKAAVAEAKKGGGAAFSPSNPVYQQSQMNLNSVNVRINSLRSKIRQKSDLIARLKSHADQATEMHAQLSRLTRNYNVTKKQYNQLLNSLYSAKLTQSAQSGGDQLKVRVVDPPVKPLKPVGPHRIILMSVVLVISLIAGGAFAFFLSETKPVFMNQRNLQETTGLPVLGSVTMALNQRQRGIQRTRLIVFTVAILALFIGYAGAIAFMHSGVDFVQSVVRSRSV